MGLERRPVHRRITGAATPDGVPAAVPEAALVTDKYFATSEPVPVLTSSVSGWMIHFPAVVWTRSPDTMTPSRSGVWVEVGCRIVCACAVIRPNMARPATRLRATERLGRLSHVSPSS